MSDESRVVGVVGPDPLRRDVADRLAAAGVASLIDDISTIADAEPSLVVTVGEVAVRTAVDASIGCPIVPVDARAGIRAVPRGAVDAMAEAIAAGRWGTERHRPFSVSVGDERMGIAVADVALLTAEAARISEYAVTVDGEPLDRARADGVVVATPAGSTEYARRIEAPVLAPGTGAAVAWIAPFRSDPDRWVVQPTTLTIEVERDETTVDLLLDGEVLQSVGPADVVTIEPEQAFEVAVVPASRDRAD